MIKIWAFIAAFSLMSVKVAEEKIISGKASWYGGKKFENKKMANGERFHQSKMTAASNHFPLGTKLKVFTDKDTIVVKVTDRMGKKTGAKRKLDLSKSAMKKLKGIEQGVIDVQIQIL